MRFLILVFLIGICFNILAQNIGINNTNPQSSLDVKGDVVFRVDTLELQNGTNDNIDVITSKSMNYVIIGPNTTFEIGGFNGGIDGRIISLYNATPAAFYIKNYSAGSTANNQINTGTGGDFLMNSYSTITFQYLAIDGNWHVISRYNEVGSAWAINGNDIYNTNTNNIGVGTSSPSEKLDIVGNIRTSGEIKPDGIAGQANQVLTSNGNGTMQWALPQSNNNGYIPGVGSWGDCSMYNIEDYYPVSDSMGTDDDFFGSVLCISGDYAIVGAHYDNEDGINDTGSASIFKRNNTTGAWEQQGSKLTNPNAAYFDLFGQSVSISGDYAIVGAPYDDESGFVNNGSATIFKRNATTGTWEQQGSKLTNPNAAHDDYFGVSVSISGDYAIIGSFNDDEGGFSNTGSASIFKRNATTGSWEQQGSKLTNPNAAHDDYFGYSVSISGDYAIVGAPYDDESGLLYNGSATIFKRNNITGDWEQQGPKLTNPSAANDDYFGYSVSISGNYAIVGALSDDEFGFIDNGSVTIFKRNSTTGVWEQHGPKLTNSNAANYDNFGHSVSISGDYAIVGAVYDDEGEFNNNGSSTIFKRFGSVWQVSQKIIKPNSSNNNYFGRSVSIDSNNLRFLIGANGIQSYTGMAFFGKVK